MLHALLHNKLDELIPEPQRREDALTSAAFGTLVLVDAWDILARWLRVSEQPASTAGLWNSNCWFWPRLAFAEPDVVLRLGDFLVVVEAKYRSGRNDLVAAEEGDADLCDQLVRQHRSITEPVDSRVRYAEPIEHAIAECRLVQVFVSDSRRHRRARREWEESKRRLPLEAILRFVTWQDLFKLLNDPQVLQNRWAMDLCSYLQVCGLDSFEGIGRHLAGPEDLTRIRQWREQDDYGRWQHAVAPLFTGRKIAGLKGWRSLTKETATGRWVHGIDHRVIGSARNAIVGWCSTSNEHSDRRPAKLRRRNP